MEIICVLVYVIFLNCCQRVSGTRNTQNSQRIFKSGSCKLERVFSQKHLYQLRCLKTILDNYMFQSLLAIFRLSSRELKFVLYIYCARSSSMYIVKCKAVPLQACSGPEGSRKVRFSDFVTTTQNGGRLSALRTGRLYPWYSFLLKAESTPRAIVRSEGFYVNEKFQ